MEDLDEEEEQELLPEWIDDYIVIGEIPQSGNYFLMPMTGSDKGKFIEFEHDGFEFIERGEDMQPFVEKIAMPSDELIAEICSHTRYSDSKTDIQWLAQRYEWGAL